MKRVLVTGASGFIGRHAPALLKAKGYDVHTVSRTHLPTDGVTWHEGDLLNASDVSRIVAEVRPTHLLHFAWIATPGVYQESPENDAWLTASVHLLEECIKAGTTRIVGAGSSFEYDWGTGLCDEFDTPLNPTTLYGKKKVECFRALEAIGEGKNVSVAWGRIFFVFGPYESEKRLASSVIKSLVEGKTAELTHGRQVRDFLYSEDVASAFVALLDSDVTGPVNVGSGHAMSIRELVTKAADIVGRPELLAFDAKQAPPNEPPRIEVAVDRLRNEVRWTEPFGLEEGLKRTIEWWASRSARSDNGAPKQG